MFNINYTRDRKGSINDSDRKLPFKQRRKSHQIYYFQTDDKESEGDEDVETDTENFYDHDKYPKRRIFLG